MVSLVQAANKQPEGGNSDEQQGYDRKSCRMSDMGAHGYELVSTTYIPAGPDKDGNPIGKMYYTFKRELPDHMDIVDQKEQLESCRKNRWGTDF